MQQYKIKFKLEVQNFEKFREITVVELLLKKGGGEGVLVLNLLNLFILNTVR